MWIKIEAIVYEFPIVADPHGSVDRSRERATMRYINTSSVAFAEDGGRGVFLRMNDGSLLEARDPEGRAFTWPDICRICRVYLPGEDD